MDMYENALRIASKILDEDADVQIAGIQAQIAKLKKDIAPVEDRIMQLQKTIEPKLDQISRLQKQLHSLKPGPKPVSF